MLPSVSSQRRLDKRSSQPLVAQEHAFARTLLAVRALLRMARYWGPLVAGFVCLVAVQFAGTAIGWLLLLLGFGLIFEGASAIWVRAGSAGNLTNHRQ